MALTRRQFLRRSGLAAGGLASYGLFSNPFVRRALADVGDKYLVVLFLDGGNDGLNTVTPIGGGSAFVVQEPENNIVRGAYIALAAALSGAQTMALPTYDEAYTIPSAKAQLIALRTMQICAEESGAADTVDPLAGSYYVEAITNAMEEQIVAEMEAVERMGGIVHAVTDLLVKRSVNVASLDSRVMFAPDSGTPLFVLEAELQIPSEVALAGLQNELAALCQDENLDLTFDPKP